MKKIYFETYGCSASFSNAEIMKGILKKNYLIIENLEDADVIIINTCIVKSPTETKMWRRLKYFSTLNKFVVVAGCMPEVYSKRIQEKHPSFSLLGPRNIDKIKEVVDAFPNKKVILGKRNIVKSELPKFRRNKIIDIEQISDGCLGNCSYCSVKFAKGRLHSYPIESVVTSVEKAVAEGCREIWLTSQDNSAYGIDFSQSGRSKLPQLIRKVAGINGKFFVRIGMMNPEHIIPVLDELVDAFDSDKVFKFIHIPVQSGNNRVLSVMKRHYTVEDFEEIVKAFRRRFPRISVSTDIICGFPTETEEEFEDTLKLIKEVKPAVLNISRYWARPMTEASKLKQVDGKEIKRRSKKATELFEDIAKSENEKWINWTGEVLIDEASPHIIGRNYAYKPIVLRGEYKLGTWTKVKVKSSTTYNLIAE